MKPVYQQKEDDCLSACIASILEMPLVGVPIFKGNGAQQFAICQSWLRKLGYGLVEITWNGPKKTLQFYGGVPLYCIGTIIPKGSPWTHAVVVRLDKGRVRVVHDPDPATRGKKRYAKNRLLSVGLIVSMESIAA